jgi:hypothetical protein
MPKTNYGSFKKSPETPSEYTDAQYKALDALKEPGLRYGMARTEFANKVLLADGTISDDLESVRSATKAADDADTAAWKTFREQHADAILDGTLDPALRTQLQDLRYHGVRPLARELDEHIESGKFLLVVDADKVIHTYFPVVDESHPDYERTSTAGA